jgi:chromosome condensin MukBEF MukE localization factor
VKRVFWFGIGVATGVSLSRKAHVTARKATPTGVAENVGSEMRELAEAIGSFGADVRAGMSEREDELNESVERASGYSLMPDHGQQAKHALREQAAPSPGPRARRAGG